jgi:hypothetical protein
VISGPPPLRFGAALAVLRILDLGRDEGFAESGFNLFKEPKISFGDTLILLVASPSVTRLSEKKVLPIILILYVFHQHNSPPHDC